MLALHANQLVSAQRLADVLWNESTPAAMTRLHNLVSALRRGLRRYDQADAACLATHGPGYMLRARVDEFDHERFGRLADQGRKALACGDTRLALDRLRAALALWRGPALVDTDPKLIAREAPRLEETRLTVTEDLFDIEIAAGRDAELITGLADLIAEHPLRERPRGQLMLAYYRNGRQAEALRLYQETRRLLVNELGIEPGTALSELHTAILQGDPALDSPAERAIATGLAVEPEGGDQRAGRPRMAEPAQLPADLPDFIGRADVIDRITRRLAAPGPAPIAAVSGMAGIGKTTLAVRIAHRLRHVYPDAQLFADLRGAGSAPTDPADVLAAFLRALGVATEAIPASLAERTALYRSLLAPLRALVLLDNARNSAQVRPLLPGCGAAAVLVTGRDPLAGLTGAVHTHLDVFGSEGAVELLARTAGAERVAADPEAAVGIADACGGLPLAVRIAGARLAARPRWRVRDLAERLVARQCLDELVVGDEGVRASFQLSYQALAPAAARAFRLLAVPDLLEISKESAAAVLDTDIADAEALAETLVDAQLLSSPGAGRYRYHDLLRLFACETSQRVDHPDERRTALRRILEVYPVARQPVGQLSTRRIDPQAAETISFPASIWPESWAPAMRKPTP
jgi:DNA-binding SARP family transcriptional activator